MPHPRNRRERFFIGKRKGEVRAAGETCGFTWSHRTEEEKQESLKRWAYLRRETTKPCSCSMCGNPRRNRWGKKSEQLTMQERRLGGIWE